MIRCSAGPVYLCKGVTTFTAPKTPGAPMARTLLSRHDVSGEAGRRAIRFDALISHDITYVGIVQTARASGLARFPLPYALTNCHNSLCAVGGTINEDDHAFGLSAAVKYGGVYVPANMAVIHQYARERMAVCGGMLLGSDSHTRYGALGALGVGEGGPELVKQLLGGAWETREPEVVLVYLTGAPKRGVGPHDVALALCAATYESGFVKNKILEFTGPGVANLSMDFRIGIDVMTTETACLSSLWETDETTRGYYERHHRPSDYTRLAPEEGAKYDGLIEIDLSAVEPMIALPFHPSRALPIRAFRDDAGDILREAEKRGGAGCEGRLTGKLRGGRLLCDQGIIAGCAGGLYENIAEAAQILKGGSVGDGAFSLSVYPPSVPVQLALSKAGVLDTLMEAGAILKPCFCGPCFGAGDVPANGALSIRHTTRNFPHREGSRPTDHQMAWVALMDARSIAATARNRGLLTPATDVEYDAPTGIEYPFDETPYLKRVYNGFGAPKPETKLVFGPGIADWPKIPKLPENLLLNVASVLPDSVTTTDELIPSGETSSYRSNLMKLASFTLSRRDPGYVERARAALAAEEKRASGDAPQAWLARLPEGVSSQNVGFGSCIYANCPGDGSAREQAASCQRVLGGCANIARAYATKRYRSNLVNWGLLPFVTQDEFAGETGDFLWIPGIRSALKKGETEFTGYLLRGDTKTPVALSLPNLATDERRILLNGCLINDYGEKNQ